MAVDKQYIETTKILNTIREINEKRNSKKSLINEEYENAENTTNENNKPIAITNAANFGENVLQNQEDEFRSVVDSGATFSKENEDEPESNPLVYYPATEDVVFSGKIPNKGNMIFQFRLVDRTGEGCYIWVENLSLTEDVLKTLNKLRGYYLNWKEKWQKERSVLQNLTNKNN